MAVSGSPRPPAEAAARTNIAGHAIDRSTVPLLVTLGLGVFAGALDLGVLSPALPALARAFNVGPGALAWVFTLYLLANVASIPVMTKLADRNGRRPVYIACVAIFAAGSILAISARTFTVFLIARAIQAAGAGGIFPVATAAIADRVPPERRGAALGLVAATWGLAAIIGPSLGGVLTHLLSWHWIFAANIPLAIVVIAMARTTLPAKVSNVRGPLDVVGIVTLTLGLLAVMIGLTQLGAVLLPMLGAGAALFAAFIAVERRAAEPVIKLHLFAQRQLQVTNGLEILIGILEGALFFIPAALVAAEHLTYAAAGGIAALGAFMFVAVIPGAGRALDAIGSRWVLTAGTLLTAAGLMIFAVGFGVLWIAIAAMIVAGTGFGALLGAPTRYIITNSVAADQRASAVGLLSIFLIIGQILGGSLAGGIIGTRASDIEGYRFAYVAFAAIAGVAALLTLALKSKAAEAQALQAKSGST
jgi:EmrB/QacA subfamily drug resistance transporter